MGNHWVHDFETLSNCFIAVFEHYKTDDKKIFVIHELRDDFEEFLNFLESNVRQKEWHISYNGLSFDSQITEFIIRKRELLKIMESDERAEYIYQQAQNVISRQDRGEWNEFNEKDLHIKQIDVFKLNHWDNPAKRSSLKWIQYSMDWDNIQEMPIHHTERITTIEEINMIISYCINDVRSTKRIMQLSKDQIKLRQQLTTDYKINLFSASEARISKELFLHFLSEATGIPKYELRQLRTNRNIIVVKDLILPYVRFKTEIFQDLLDNFKMLMIDAQNTKNSFKYSLKYKGVKTDFGLGGVHGCTKPGIYKAEEGMIIITSDVTSFYPNLAIRNKWAPAHLPQKEFCDQYEWFFNERVLIPKSDPRNYVYKLILNTTYGLSNDKNSFLYDPLFTMKITINGQLSLMMLYEMLAEGIPNCQLLMQNTDGLEMKIPEEYKEKYFEICNEWEKITNLKLEHDEYSKLIIADVNNYIAVNKAGKYKCKGRFEFENLALHKNKSFLIVPKAIFNYFINDIPPEKYIIQNRNIFDYCAGVKVNSGWEFQETAVKQKIPAEYNDYSTAQKHDLIKANGWEQSWADDNWVRLDAINKEAFTGVFTEKAFWLSIKKESVIEKNILQKTIRYYVSNKGCKIVKVNKDDRREIQIEAGKWMQSEFSKYSEKNWEDYDINDAYYLEKIYNEISNIVPPQSNQMSFNF